MQKGLRLPKEEEALNQALESGLLGGRETHTPSYFITGNNFSTNRIRIPQKFIYPIDISDLQSIPDFCGTDIDLVLFIYFFLFEVKVITVS